MKCAAAGRSHQGSCRRSLGIEALLHWTFAIQCAQLELPADTARDADFDRPSYGAEWIIQQRHLLGCTIDGGAPRLPPQVHDDAEAVAAVVGGLLPFRVSTRIADLARAGRRPDWMPGAKPRCLPSDVHVNPHGWRAKVEVLRVTIERKARGRPVRREWGWCRVRYDPHPDRIAEARAAYTAWRGALASIREALIGASALRDHVLTPELPPAAPWEDGVATPR